MQARSAEKSGHPQWAAGSRTSVVNGSGTTSYTTNELNQYTEVADVNYTYHYNATW